jgi:hypothetical protein
MPRQKVRTLDAKRKCSRIQKFVLVFQTLGQLSRLTSSQIMIKNPIVIAATAAARFSSAQVALGQMDWSATSTPYDS